MAIESFRQLILDVQAMMDPDFAGKLAADVAAGADTGEADTGFEFGESSNGKGQLSLSDAEEIATEEQGRDGFRAPDDAATLPELIRFLIDRTGYIKALEAEGSPEVWRAMKQSCCFEKR